MFWSHDDKNNGHLCLMMLRDEQIDKQVDRRTSNRCILVGKKRLNIRLIICLYLFLSGCTNNFIKYYKRFLRKIDRELQLLHRLLLLQAMKVFVEVFLPPRCVRHKVVILVQENHWLLSYTEEYNLLFAKAQQASNNSFSETRLPASPKYTTSESNWKQSLLSYSI